MIAKDFRLKRNQIDYLLDKGSSLRSKLFIARFAENNKDFPRFCVIISKKLSAKAVERNRLRRQIYEAIRISEITKEHLKIDFVLIPKKSTLNMSFPEITKDLKSLSSKITN